MKKIKLMLVGWMAVFGMVLVPVASVGAVNPFQPCDGNSDSAVCASTSDDLPTFIKTIVNTLLIILGAVSVIIIVSSGIRYATSHGDPGNVKNAKDTLMYAVVGLVVAISAYAIVNFVANQFWGDNDESSFKKQQISAINKVSKNERN